MRLVHTAHSLLQQCIWASFGHQTIKKHPSGQPKDFVRNYINLKHIIDLFHLHIIQMTLFKDIMPNFDRYVHVYG